MDIFSFILGRSSNEQESYQRIEDIKRETGLRNLEIKELELETARIIDRGTLNKLILDLNRDEKKRDDYINNLDKLNDIKSRILNTIPPDLGYLDKIEKQKNYYISLLNDIKKEITRKTIYINEIKNNIDRLQAKGREYYTQVRREIRRRWDNINYIFNSSTMLIADLYSDNINDRYLFLVLEKENFTNEHPEKGGYLIYHIKYFRNFWLNYRKVGGKNGFYYLNIDNPLIGKTFKDSEGRDFPEYPKVPGKGEFIAKKDKFKLNDAQLIINDGLKNNPFIEVYKKYLFTASEVFVNEGRTKFRNSPPPLTVGSKKQRMAFLTLLLYDLIPQSNIFVLDIYND